MSKTTRWGHPYPEVGDAADVPKWMKELALSVDDVAKDDQGTLAARPTSTAETPGKKGRYYYATDKGVLYRDTGTSWTVVSVPNEQGTLEGRPAAGVAGRTYFATDYLFLYRDTGSAWTLIASAREGSSPGASFGALSKGATYYETDRQVFYRDNGEEYVAIGSQVRKALATVEIAGNSAKEVGLTWKVKEANKPFSDGTYQYSYTIALPAGWSTTANPTVAVVGKGSTQLTVRVHNPSNTTAVFVVEANAFYTG